MPPTRSRGRLAKLGSCTLSTSRASSREVTTTSGIVGPIMSVMMGPCTAARSRRRRCTSVFTTWCTLPTTGSVRGPGGRRREPPPRRRNWRMDTARSANRMALYVVSSMPAVVARGWDASWRLVVEVSELFIGGSSVDVSQYVDSHESVRVTYKTSSRFTFVILRLERLAH
jgi:hypothetical protein